MVLVECVPNFSEGRRQDVIDAILDAIRQAGSAKIIDARSDADHNRTVVTMVGNADEVFNGAFACIQKAAELINMDEQKGEHPRIGATDVVPFVPISGITIEECTQLAIKLAEKVSAELEIPVYLYEAAAARPDRVNLANIRKGQYEGLKEAILTDSDRKPDYGPSKLPTAGATVIGAREFLIAYNIYLNTTDVSIAKQIAFNIRHKNGGYRYVKSMGFETKPFVQVSMNLTNYKETPMHMVVETVRNEAKRYGLVITETEVYGMIPSDALLEAAEYYLQLNGKYERSQVIEKKLDAMASAPSDLKDLKVDGFIRELASDSPAPGGGSVACMSGAMGAALGAMVSRLTKDKKGYEDVKALFEEKVTIFDELHAKLTVAIDTDANAFNEVMKAFKLPKESEEEKAARSQKIQEGYKHAANVPLENAKLCRKVIDELLLIVDKANKSALSDVAVGLQNAYAGMLGAIMNVEINLGSIKDESYIISTKKEIKTMQSGVDTLVNDMISKIRISF